MSEIVTYSQVDVHADEAVRQQQRDALLALFNDETDEEGFTGFDVAVDPTLPSADATTTAPQIKWGNCHGLEAIWQAIAAAYEEIVKWKVNIISVPKGEARKQLIEDLTRILKLFVGASPWKEFSLQLVHIFLPLMLQKPHSRSEPRDHTRFLLVRLKLWLAGDLKSPQRSKGYPGKTC